MPRTIPASVSAVFRMPDKSLALAFTAKRTVRYLRTVPVADATLDQIIEAVADRSLHIDVVRRGPSGATARPSSSGATTPPS